MIDRRIDDVDWFNPLQFRPYLLAADGGGVEQILNIDIEALRFVAHHGGQREQPLVVRQRRGVVQNGRRAKDRRKRRSQLVRH
jgi:hypothetical protein